MIGAVEAAAIIGFAAAGSEIRRRLVIRARIARRLAPAAGPMAKRFFRFPAKPLEEADAA